MRKTRIFLLFWVFDTVPLLSVPDFRSILCVSEKLIMRVVLESKVSGDRGRNRPKTKGNARKRTVLDAVSSFFLSRATLYLSAPENSRVSVSLVIQLFRRSLMTLAHWYYF